MFRANDDNKPFKVLIVGGGLAGLVLANGLKNKGISCEVYERDVDPDFRTQGWSLSMHMALQTLHDCIPKHRFEYFGREVGVNHEKNEGGMTFTNFNGLTGEIETTLTAPPYKVYRVNRKRFRKWLLQDVQDLVHWNKKVSRYEEHADGVKVFFADGTHAEGDLLVATDGSMSTVARQLLGEEKFQSMTRIHGVRGYGCSRWISEEEWNALAPEGTVSGIIHGHGSNNTEIMKKLKSCATNAFHGVTAHQQFIVNTPDDTPLVGITIRERVPVYDVYMANTQRVVLAGDAADPMSMFRGEGGNHAILDVGVLVNEINNVVSNSKSLKEAISDYYKEIIPRVEQAVEASSRAATIMHTNPEGIRQMMEERAALVFVK
ncbi:FAD/NAD(P)-binding domain-containing protein [Rhizopus microsporus var. microsporus]|uniref:FAD/NAD(P)-binding domain-containing protein n=1 Tax=Rhizopus microsporus var. microsporus TaxID=86635 RepID=A0A1X0RGB4_RHIZD|nr:FAD/NAD(P)-binding domain-containing protein [Rhizopus microsporus var. microsporus]